MVQEPTFRKSLGWGFRLQNFLARAILSPFWNLMCGVKGILNSNPWTAEFLKDPNSSQVLSPVKILTMESKIVSRVSCIQHFANEFWSCWKEEYLQSLQEYQKWESKKMDFRDSNIVIVYQANASRSYITMARVIGVTMVSRVGSKCVISNHPPSTDVSSTTRSKWQVNNLMKWQVATSWPKNS